MHAPFLTIIIPTLNSAKTLQVALDSVLGQEFRDLECWIIDSVSKDDTLLIIEENARKDDRVRFISEPDKGIFDAMNKGIGLASGQWLYFLGSDDKLMDSQVLGTVAEDLNSGQYDLVYGNIVVTGRSGVFFGKVDREKLLTENISHQAIFYRNELFHRLGGYDVRYRAYADWGFNLRCFQDPSTRIKFVDRIIAEYAPGGFSAVNDALFLREVLFPANLTLLSEKGIAYLRPIGRYDALWRLIRNARIRKQQDVNLLTADLKVSACIKKTIEWQGRIPYRVLSVGGFSKFFMLISYLSSRLTFSI